MTPIRVPGIARAGECTAGDEEWVCGNAVYARGICRGHYDQQRRGKSFTPFKSTIAVEQRWNEHGERLCTECRRYLPTSAFQRASKGPDGLQTICSTCHRGRWLIRGYGIAAAEYAEISARQGGVCAICRERPGDARLAVDHDHACCPGKSSCGRCVRGLLCRSCNHGLGNFRDDTELLSGAINYLTSRRR